LAVGRSNSVSLLNSRCPDYKLPTQIYNSKIADESSEAGYKGTNALMCDFIWVNEKSVWMYSAYIK
jgi:DNA-binding ferritin-like protein